METFALIIRAIVIVGAVTFAFTALGVGFYLVLREYRLVRTFRQLKEFVELTGRSGLEADIAKGTISLSRTRPGLIIMGIGALLLGLCVMKPLEIRTDQRSIPPLKPIQLDVSDYSVGSTSTYDAWLNDTDKIRKSSLTEHGILLGASLQHGEGIGYEVFFSKDGDSLEAIAEGVYGDKRYAPLVDAFNPHLAGHPERIPKDTLVKVWRVGSERNPTDLVIRRFIHIAGEDKEDIYSAARILVEKATKRPEFFDDPRGVVAGFPEGLFGLIAAFKTLTGKAWGLRSIQSQDGDTGDTLARVHYGSRENLDYLLLANNDDRTLFDLLRSRTNDIPAGTDIRLIHLILP